jgi:hypothetical protein
MSIIAAASDIVLVFIAAINSVATGLRPVYSESEPATGRWLVSWQLSGCAAKQSGCQILPVADADQGSSSRCSGIGSRAVISNSNSYWSDQVAALLWGRAAWPARIYKQELFNL